MKKKLTAIALVICLMAVAVIGGSLAYFTDTKDVENVFTTGDVEIEIQEVFEEGSKLIPGIDVEKKVNVANTGSERAFVRVHIAIPTILDSGDDDDPRFAAYDNLLHWNMSKASLVDGLWNWNQSADGPNYPGNGGTWNFYERNIGGVDYTVYVATYETALEGETGVTAEEAIHKVYLDVNVTDELLEDIVAELGEIKILVAAEGAQEAGFEGKAYEALNTQFGDPMSEDYESPWEKAA
ncbi:MAG: hypothetical protein IJE09_04180 [Oscillospiraceae bacterium]|nr:hypothetical protein [Oscillospiraceae bacterium]